MKTFDCSRIKVRIEEHVRGELSPAEAAAFRVHLDGCASCAAEAAGARRASEVVASLRHEDWLQSVDEVALGGLRARSLAAVRIEAEDASRGGWFGWTWALAGTVAAVALVAVISPAVGPGPEPVREASSIEASAAIAAAQVEPSLDVELATVANRAGVTLKWAARGQSFVVLKSLNPGNFEAAEVTVVCGSSWTDKDPGSGIAFYRVIKARDRC